jgi:hypothetical protein
MDFECGDPAACTNPARRQTVFYRLACVVAREKLRGLSTYVDASLKYAAQRLPGVDEVVRLGQLNISLTNIKEARG